MNNKINFSSWKFVCFERLNQLMFVFLALTMLACSDDDGNAANVGMAPNESEAPEISEVGSSEESESIKFRGSINSAFELKVDGIAYDDIEDFYTQELERLPEKLRATGYDENYSIDFDAQIGLYDLVYNMVVYIAAVNKHGYQAKETVKEDGSFSISLPPDAIDEAYRVRANKRISVVLQSADEVVTTCYNFSAIDKKVDFSEALKPIILSEFVTSITKYACGTKSNSDENEILQNSIIRNLSPVKKDMTKEEVLEAFGHTYLLVESSTRWCYFSTSIEQAPMCAVNFYGSCQCSLTFDEEGFLIDQYNIKSSLLDVLSW